MVIKMAGYLGVDVTKGENFFFISYNTEDMSRVSQYVKALSSKGLPIWYDYGIEVGSKWATTIADRIKNSEAVIVFLSRNIFEKKESFVHKEFEMARDYFNKEIYVVILDDIKKSEVPLRYISWWIDINHLQCILATQYSISECTDKILKAVGFKGTTDLPNELPADENSDDDVLALFNLINETIEEENAERAAAEFELKHTVKNGVLVEYKGNEETVELPSCINAIGPVAFKENNSVKKIVISNQIKSIASSAFCNCSHLNEIVVAKDNTTYRSIGSNLYSADGKTLLFYAPAQKNKSFELPASVNNIGNSAFFHCKNLTKITLPKGLISIGSSAFSDCSSLAKINIPSSVKNIGDYAFNGCKALTSLILPENISEISTRTFQYCTALTQITLPNSIKYIGSYAFNNCNSLRKIVYSGTQRQFNSVEFGENVARQAGIISVYCTDGIIPNHLFIRF